MRCIAILLLTISSLSQINGQGIEFFHGTWEEALEQAQIQEKVIFVDAFTTWCGPCKRMSKNVFTKKEVGEFFNNNFINMKIDMEKTPGRKFQQKYPVQAYPTLYFIGGDGEVVYQTKGARQADQFIELGRTVLGKTDKSGDYAEKYEKGDRDPELVYQYVKSLNKAGKPSLKISNEYLKTQEDLTTEFNLRFIFEATVEADSRIFNHLIKYRSQIEALESKEAVAKKIENACKITAQKAIEFKSDDLHEEAKSKMKKHYPKKAEAFATQVDLIYFRAKGDADNYIKVCNDYVKKELKNDPEKLHALSKEIMISFSGDFKAMRYAEKLAKKAANNGNLYNYYYTYAEILMMNGKKDDALETAYKSLDLAGEKKNVQRAINQLIQKIEQS
jgi:thiol-disulfide isomerase/thioredoxin